MNKFYTRKSLIVRIILSLLIIALLIMGFVFQPKIEEKIWGDGMTRAVSSDFKMYVVDVGQGDAIFLEFADNKTMLVDCGKKKEKAKLASFLEEKEVTKIDYLVYTHTDEDHVGGGEYVFENYEVDVLYRPKYLSKTENEKFGNPNNYKVKSDSKAYDNAIMLAYEEEGCEIRYSFEGEEIVGLDYKVKFLSPDKDNYTSSNSYSAVLMLEVYDRKILLTGDAEKDIEDKLISKYDTYLDVDILKLGHHGSKTSSSQNFLSLTNPNYAFISVGENQWDMPNEEVKDRLSTANIRNVYDTKTYGTIIAGIDKNSNMHISSYKGSFRLDMPIFIAILSVLLLLVWGIRIKSLKKAKNSKTRKKTIKNKN